MARPEVTAALDRLMLAVTGYVLVSLHFQGPRSALASAVVLVWVALRERPAIAALWRDTRAGWLWIGAALVLGVVFSELPDKSAKGAYDFLRGCLMVLLVVQLRRLPVETVHRYLRFMALAALAVLAGLYVWLGLRHGLRTPGYFSALDAVINNRNIASRGIGMLYVILLAGLVAGADGRRALLPVVAGLVLCLGLLLLNDSRGAVLAVWLATVAMLAHGGCRATAGLVLTAGLLLGGVWLTILLTPELPDVGLVGRPGEFTSGRLDLYQAVWDAILAAPWMGWGINTYKYLEFVHVLPVTYSMPHSIYLELVFSLGLVGSAVMLAGLIRLWRGRGGARPAPGYLTALGWGMVIYAAVYGLVDMKLFGFSAPTALMLGIVLARGLGARPGAGP